LAPLWVRRRVSSPSAGRYLGSAFLFKLEQISYSRVEAEAGKSLLERCPGLGFKQVTPYCNVSLKSFFFSILGFAGFETQKPKTLLWSQATKQTSFGDDLQFQMP